MARTRAAIFGAALVLAGSLASAVPAANAARPVAKPPPLLAVTVSANQPAGLAHGSRATSTWKSGAFSGFSAIAAKDFGVWRGRPVTSATEFQTNASWQAFDSAQRVIQGWQGQNSGILLSIAVPLWAGYGDHLAATASGYYNQHFVAMARKLVAAGLGHSVLRLGWEFNGGWFRWGITYQGKRYQYDTRARQFAAAWRQVAESVAPGSPSVDFSAEVVTVLPADVPVEELLDRAVTGVRGDKGGGRRSFSVGVSRVARSLEDLPDAYNQARRAVTIGRRVRGTGSTTHFDQLGLHRLIALVPDAGELRAFAEDVLGPLAGRDADAAGLRETLQVLLDTNFNVAEAARLQFFHYNTMRYRVGKLQRLLGPVATDPHLRLDVAVALRALEIVG